jgi:hypothetical protein
MVKGSNKDKGLNKKLEETHKKNKNDFMNKSPSSPNYSDDDSSSFITKKPSKVKSPINKPSNNKYKTPSLAEQKRNNKKKTKDEEFYLKSPSHSRLNTFNKKNAESLVISSPKSHNENYILSPMQYFPEDIKAEKVGSFSVMSPQKIVNKSSHNYLIYGSIDKNSPLKVIGLKPKDKENNVLECLVKWKNKGKEVIQDSIVDAKEIRERFPKLLLDFLEERIKFISNK